MIQLIFTCLQLNLIQFSPWPPARAWLDCISFSGRCLLRERAAGSSSRFSWRMNHWYRGICSQFAGDSSQSVERNKTGYTRMLQSIFTNSYSPSYQLDCCVNSSNCARHLRFRAHPGTSVQNSYQILCRLSNLPTSMVGYYRRLLLATYGGHDDFVWSVNYDGLYRIHKVIYFPGHRQKWLHGRHQHWPLHMWRLLHGIL